MTAVASEGVPRAHHRLEQRLRPAVLGPHGEMGLSLAAEACGIDTRDHRADSLQEHAENHPMAHLRGPGI